jgi:hypothetical protein
VLASRGDFYQSDGNYEVWLKVIPKLGNALQWVYFTGEAEKILRTTCRINTTRLILRL